MDKCFGCVTGVCSYNPTSPRNIFLKAIMTIKHNNIIMLKIFGMHLFQLHISLLQSSLYRLHVCVVMLECVVIYLYYFLWHNLCHVLPQFNSLRAGGDIRRDIFFQSLFFFFLISFFSEQWPAKMKTSQNEIETQYFFVFLKNYGVERTQFPEKEVEVKLW